MTKIEWCDATINPVTGCTPVSEGCKKCYAASIAKRFWGERKFSDIKFHPERLDAILHMRKPRKIFLDSMGDIFNEDVDPRWIDRILWNVAEHNRHTYLMLTKRPDIMAEYFSGFVENREGVLDRVMRKHTMPYYQSFHKSFMTYRTGGSIPNLWLGITAENQARLDERLPHLMQCPGKVKFVSLEPLLGEIDLKKWINKETTIHISASVQGMLRNRNFDCVDRDDGTRMSQSEVEAELWKLHSEGVKVIPCGKKCEGFSSETGCPGHKIPALDWVIVGAETGPGRRPCKLEWIKSIVRQCKDAGVPVFVKSYVDERGKVVKDFDQFPDSIRFREFPS